MTLMLIFALFGQPETTFIPFESMRECESVKPEIIGKLKEMGAVAYSLACVPLVKMDSV
jgi:hypothetical protein